MSDILTTPELTPESVKVITTPYFNPVIWEQMKGMAQTFYISKAIPSHFDNVAKVVAAMQVGLEMGMKPMEALNSLYPVNGSWNIWGKALTRRLREHGYTPRYLEETSEFCRAEVTKGNKSSPNFESYEDTFHYIDAVASGWTTDRDNKQKPGWLPGQNRKLKLRYGVLSSIIKSYIPEVLGAANDIKEVAEDYPVIEVPKLEKQELTTRKENINENISLIKDLLKLRKKFITLASDKNIAVDEAKQMIQEYYDVPSFDEVVLEQLSEYMEKIESGELWNTN